MPFDERHGLAKAMGAGALGDGREKQRQMACTQQAPGCFTKEPLAVEPLQASLGDKRQQADAVVEYAFHQA